jgi:hypothetical protein
MFHINGYLCSWAVVTKLILTSPRLTGVSSATTSEVWTSTILKWLKLQDWRVWCRGHLRWYDLPTKFYENVPVDSKVITVGQRDIQTNRETGSLIRLQLNLKGNIYEYILSMISMIPAPWPPFLSCHHPYSRSIQPTSAGTATVHFMIRFKYSAEVLKTFRMHYQRRNLETSTFSP